MKSIVVRTATRLLMPLLLVFSVFLLLRGHNAPGGGFVGGLVASAAFAVYAVAFSVPAARSALGVGPRVLIAVGLLLAVASAFLASLKGEIFMTGQWTETYYPAIGKLGTPLVFDLGVYLVVLGVMLTIILTLAED